LFSLRVWLALIPVFLIRWGMGRYFRKRIGGYTGDCLGATQQIAEVTFYLFALI
jgi:adenosylcobinamide-GDP ribazoletransferase